MPRGFVAQAPALQVPEHADEIQAMVVVLTVFPTQSETARHSFVTVVYSSATHAPASTANAAWRPPVLLASRFA